MLKIVTIPNPVLTTKASQVKQIDDDLRKLVADMIDTCRKAKGIGLAAPQIGKSIRLCIIDLEEFNLPPFALINPEIKKKSWRKIEMEEGCLSIPNIFGIVKRPAKVTVEALTLNGEKKRFEADGLLARVVQHEIDHLDGILFTTKMIRQTSGKPEEKM
ncbi:MAG TPA: peptide deformylase [Verrucomicrobiae bacterium]|nr:peptide deformylase [Verrucomicrobiae bacterium]